MSYPVYLFHVAVIMAVRDFLGSHSTLLIIVLTLILAFVVNYFVEEPLELYRQRRATKQKRSEKLEGDVTSTMSSWRWRRVTGKIRRR